MFKARKKTPFVVFFDCNEQGSVGHSQKDKSVCGILNIRMKTSLGEMGYCNGELMQGPQVCFLFHDTRWSFFLPQEMMRFIHATSMLICFNVLSPNPGKMDAAKCCQWEECDGPPVGSPPLLSK